MPSQASENTLVITTTDHGIELPGGMMTLRDGGLGVMLMLRGPDGFRGGRVMDGLVSHLVCIRRSGTSSAGPRPPGWRAAASSR